MCDHISTPMGFKLQFLIYFFFFFAAAASAENCNVTASHKSFFSKV